MEFRVDFKPLVAEDFIKDLFQEEANHKIPSYVESSNNKKEHENTSHGIYKIYSASIDNKSIESYQIIEDFISNLRMSEKINRITTKKEWQKIFIRTKERINKDSIKNMNFFLKRIHYSKNNILESEIYKCIDSLNKHLEKERNNIDEDEIYENTKYSLINLLSKHTELKEVLSKNCSFSIDEKSGCISLDIVETPIGMSYDVVLNIKFLSNGNVSFACYDGDRSDNSYINGIITKHETYMSNHKFKSILLLSKQGE